jgi:hypothetical protein
MAAPTSHVVLAIDNSRSMETADVEKEGYARGHKMRRCDAVQCEGKKALDSVLAAPGHALLSVIYFDDHARSEVKASPLTKELAARAMSGRSQPRLGTNFSECWQAIEAAIDGSRAAAATNHHVIFLTDGAPGELPGRKNALPCIGAELPISRYHKMEHPSAPAIVRRLARKHKCKLSVYAVGFGEDDFRWPRRLADIATAEGADGRFILSSASSAGNLREKLGTRTPLAEADASAPPQFERPGTTELGAIPDHQRASTRVRGAASAMAVTSMAPPAVPQRGSSLASAFGSITSSITSSMSMGTSDSQKNRRLRPYAPEHKDAWKRPEGWKTMVAHELVVDDDIATLKEAINKCTDDGEWDRLAELTQQIKEKELEQRPGQRQQDDMQQPQHSGGVATVATTTERWRQCTVSIRPAPFARGGQQNAYHMKVDGLHCVAKESRWEEEGAGEGKARLEALKLSVKETNVATKLAHEFNQVLVSTEANGAGSISVVPVSIYRLSLRIGERDRFMSVERFLDGRFLKANGNNGYISAAAKFAPLSKAVSKSNATQIMPHAFTHWSFEHTGGEMMVCDIQGVRLDYTDVNVHSKDRQFGSTDLGELGFEKFIRTHTCNAACRQLGLVELTAEDTEGGAGAGASSAAAATTETASTATEKIELIRSKHLQHRKRERGVDTIEMKRAIKHGRKEPGNAGTGRIKHTHGGVSVVTVTDATGRTGVTTYRNASSKERSSNHNHFATGGHRQPALPHPQAPMYAAMQMPSMQPASEAAPLSLWPPTGQGQVGLRVGHPVGLRGGPAAAAAAAATHTFREIFCGGCRAPARHCVCHGFGRR